MKSRTTALFVGDLLNEAKRKRRKPAQLKQKSVQHLKQQNIDVANVEHWNSFAHVRQDLFGLFDLLALYPGRICGIQVTSAEHRAAHLKKIFNSEIFPRWLNSGASAELHVWSKVKNRWRLETLKLEAFGAVKASDAEGCS